MSALTNHVSHVDNIINCFVMSSPVQAMEEPLGIQR